MRRLLRRYAPAILCIALLAGVLAAPARALDHPFFGTVADGFEGACGVELDSQAIYVSDYHRQAVQVLDPDNPTGPPQARIDTPSSENGPCDLAVDSEGNLYVNSWRESVLRYTPDSYPFAGNPTYGAPLEIDADRATGVAVDPLTDRAYVSHRTYVAAYEPSGEPVLSGGEPLRIGEGSLGRAFGPAVSGFAATQGYLYVADAADGTVKVFDPSGDPSQPVQVIDGAGSPGGGFTDLTDSDIAVDDSNGRILVVDNASPGAEHPAAVVAEFGRFGNYRGQLQRPLVHGQPTGVAIDNAGGPSQGNVYVTSGNDEDSLLYAFGPSDPAPVKVLAAEKSGSGEGTVTSTPAGISCGAACASEFPANSTVTLTATDDGHSLFKGWSVAGMPGACPGTGACQVTMSADRTATAEFEALPQEALTVAKSGSGEGTVTSTPAGIECGTICSAPFNTGSTVVLTASPAAHSAFRGWSVAGSPGACPGTGSCEVAMSVAAEVVAEFEALPQQILNVALPGAGQGTVTSTPAGIDCGETCEASYDQGTQVTLTATPAPGSRFAGWAGGGCSGAGACVVSLDGDTAASASFEPVRHALSVSVAGAGRVVSSPGGIDCGLACSAAFAEGTPVTLVPVPAPGYRLAAFTGACTGTRDCTLSLKGDAQVGARFEPIRRYLAVSLQGTGSGSVASQPAGIACAIECAALFGQGTRIILTATPAAGSSFSGWGGCDSADGRRCAVSLASSRNVIATFAESGELLPGTFTRNGAKASLEVSVPGPGTLSVAAKKLKPAKLTARRAGTLTLPLVLSKAGKAALARKGKLAIKLAISFQPKGGGEPLLLAKAVTFKEKRR